MNLKATQPQQRRGKILTAAPCITTPPTQQRSSRDSYPFCRIPSSHPAKTRDSCRATNVEGESSTPFRKNTDYTMMPCRLQLVELRIVARLCFFDSCGATEHGKLTCCVLHEGGWVRLLAAVVRGGDVQADWTRRFVTIGFDVISLMSRSWKEAVWLGDAF